MILTFGLGSPGGAPPAAATATASAEVRWPDGATSAYQGIVPGRTSILRQGEPSPR